MKASGLFVFSVPAILLTAGLVLTGCGEKEPSPPELSAPYLSASALGPDKIRLTWTGVENADKYFIAYALSEANLTDNALASYNTVYTQYDVTGLDPNRQYWFFVYAYNYQAGDGPKSNKVTAKTGTVTPAAPSWVGVTAKSANSINVDWTHSPYAASYQIEYWTGAYGTRSVISCEIPPYLVTGLVRNTTYNFVVRAKNAEGLSPYSMQVSAATNPR
jgi:hypothetical protein